MNKNEILDKVQAIVAEELVKERQKVTPKANFSLDLGADNLDIIALFMALEDAFNTNIPYEETKRLLTVQQVVHYIVDKIFV